MLIASSEEVLILKRDVLGLTECFKPMLIPDLVPECFGKLETSAVKTTLSFVYYLNWISVFISIIYF